MPKSLPESNLDQVETKLTIDFFTQSWNIYIEKIPYLLSVAGYYI